jgi:hypothetical protein
MANRIVHDSANWASLWVKEVDLGFTAGQESSLPGGSLAGAINQIVQKGAKIGVILDTPYLGANGNYWASIDTAALVRVSGVSGTGTDGQTVYKATGLAGALTLTVSTNIPIGYLDQPKGATGDDLWVQLVPGSAMPVTAS